MRFMKPRGQQFLERLEKEILIGDGAFGTRLYEKGIGFDISCEQLNLTQPDLVESVFREYAEAGAQVLETNTFCANRLKQRKYGLEDKVSDMARAAARISRKVAGDKLFVAGSLGPLVRRKRDLDDFTEDEIRAFYREPMRALVEEGVDVLQLETFSVLSELEIALSVALEFDVPVICQMAFGEEGTSETGVTAERAARRLREKGAHVIGANCRSGPSVVRDVIERQSRVVDVPLSAYPNAGYAQQVDGRYVYQASPQYFGEFLPQLVAAGAHLIGGCCGTTAAHVRALAEAAKGFHPTPRPHIAAGSVAEPARPAEQKSGEAFLSLMNKTEKFVTVEIEPPRGLDVRKAFEGAKLLAQTGCDSFNVPDNALAVVRIDNVIFAELLRQKIELPVILHLTCRDKNTIALQADLLGSQLVGIEAILAVTGDPAAIGDQPGASSVYDINSIGLVEMIASLNHGVTLSGSQIEKRTDFAIGVAINPNVTGERGLDGAFFKLKKKIAAGAHFAESQPMYDPEILKRFLVAAKSVEIPICVGLMPVVSQRNAEFLHNEVPGIKIPKEVRERFAGLDKRQGEEEGLRICKEMVDVALQNGACHFYIVPPLQRYELVAELVQYIKRDMKN